MRVAIYLRISTDEAFEVRQVQDARRRAEGLPVKIRRRRRRGLSDLVSPPANAPP